MVDILHFIWENYISKILNPGYFLSFKKCKKQKCKKVLYITFQNSSLTKKFLVKLIMYDWLS